MPYAVGTLVYYHQKDEWWLEDCPLKLASFYRVQEVGEFNGIIGYRLHDWWVQPHVVVVSIENYQFRIGERVRVALKVEHEEGWQNSWAARMTDRIGKEFTISKINKYGVRFLEDDDCGWPPGCLEPVR